MPVFLVKMGLQGKENSYAGKKPYSAKLNEDEQSNLINLEPCNKFLEHLKKVWNR